MKLIELLNIQKRLIAITNSLPIDNEIKLYNDVVINNISYYLSQFKMAYISLKPKGDTNEEIAYKEKVKTLEELWSDKDKEGNPIAINGKISITDEKKQRSFVESLNELNKEYEEVLKPYQTYNQINYYLSEFLILIDEEVNTIFNSKPIENRLFDFPSIDDVKKIIKEY